MQFLAENKRNSPFFQSNLFRFRYQPLFFLQKRLIRFVKCLKINGFCHSLTDFSVNLRFVDGTLHSPKLRPLIRYFGFFLNIFKA